MSHRIRPVTSVPRPQAVRSRQAILDAARALIEEEGAGAVTHQRVAERAGIGRATVYRHWPEGAELLADALETTSLHFLDPAEGRLVDRIRTDLAFVAEELNQESLTSLAATIVERSRWDDRSRALRQRLMADLVTNAERAITDAVAAGELTAAPDAADLVCQLIGPLWVRVMLQDEPITPALVDRVVDTVVGPWLTEGGGA